MQVFSLPNKPLTLTQNGGKVAHDAYGAQIMIKNIIQLRRLQTIWGLPNIRFHVPFTVREKQKVLNFIGYDIRVFKSLF